MLGRFFRRGKVRPGFFFPRGKIYTGIVFPGVILSQAVFPGEVLCGGKLYATTPVPTSSAFCLISISDLFSVLLIDCVIAGT